jgi:hypothetical protein
VEEDEVEGEEMEEGRGEGGEVVGSGGGGGGHTNYCPLLIFILCKKMGHISMYSRLLEVTIK